MKKYIAIGFGVVVLLVVMMACGQQAQEPQEKPEQPTQEVQQSESVSTEPTVPPVKTEPQNEPKASEVPEVTEPTEPAEVKDDQQAETEPVVEPTTKPVATPQENKPQEPPKSPAGQTETSSNPGGGDDLSEAEKIMRDKFLKDIANAEAQGGAVSYDATTNKDFEEIGSQLNQGIQTTITPETNGGETTQQTTPPPSSTTDNSGLAPEQKDQSIKDALAGLTGTGDHIKPGDPGWDEYVDGVAGALKPTN